MRNARIRWANVAKIGAVAAAIGGIAISLPTVLGSPDPPAPPPDVGLAPTTTTTESPVTVRPQRSSRDMPSHIDRAHEKRADRPPREGSRPAKQPKPRSHPAPARSPAAPAPAAPPPPTPAAVVPVAPPPPPAPPAPPPAPRPSPGQHEFGL